MNIIGLDSLVFGVDNLEACKVYLNDYGLIPSTVSERGGRFEALDGTAVEVYAADDQNLPKALASNTMLRETVYGVANVETIEEIKTELAKDRIVTSNDDGSISCVDDTGFALRFQVSIRKPLTVPNEIINTPGATLSRPANVLGATEPKDIVPRTLSHLVYFVPNLAKAESFYTERLGFRVVDRFSDLGPFMRPAGTQEHHTLFMIEAPEFMQGVEHFTFHMANPHELLMAGKRFQEKGYESFWGPGRHILGSNWFWYFNSPLGAHVEYDADMDLHDDNWVPRELTASEDSSQLFNFKLAQNWFPSAETPEQQK